jgi:hypothetical protein
MGIGLTVKREVLLTKADSVALERAARIKRRSQSSVIREALVEWLSARVFLREEEEAKTLATGSPIQKRIRMAQLSVSFIGLSDLALDPFPMLSIVHKNAIVLRSPYVFYAKVFYLFMCLK